MVSSNDFTGKDRGSSSYLATSAGHPADAAYKDALWNMCFMRLPEETPVRLLDVGCGTGHELMARAGDCYEDSYLIGIDTNKRLIAVASVLAEKMKVNRPQFQVGDIMDLADTFTPGTFDLVRTDRVLLHLEQPKAAVMSMLGMLKPGGLIAIADSDFGSLRFSSSLQTQADIQVVGAIRTVYDQAICQPRMAIDAVQCMKDAEKGDLIEDVEIVWWTVTLDSFDDAMKLLRLEGEDGILKDAVHRDLTTLNQSVAWECRMRDLDLEGLFHAQFEMALIVATRK
jgi:2-polyprenyl-3-methyl-5-hydroxy-6-metoxy-1,4-benzoquinol methylase